MNVLWPIAVIIMLYAQIQQGPIHASVRPDTMEMEDSVNVSIYHCLWIMGIIVLDSANMYV